MIGKNIAVIGAGYWGKNHIRVMAHLKVLHTICDSDSNVLADMSNIYDGIVLRDRWQDVLMDDTIKGVVIATPASTHYTIAKHALEMGKDVFVEKPMTLKLVEAENLLRIAENSNLILLVGHILEYHPAMVRLNGMIKEGYLGDLQYIYSSRLSFGKFRSVEDVLWSFASHDISAILMLTNKQPITVVCYGGSYYKRPVIDTAVVPMEFKGGVKAHIYVSWLHPYKHRELVVIGSEAMAVFNDTADDKLMLYKYDKTELGKGQKIPIRDTEPLLAECLDFVNCLENRNKPISDGWKGYSVVKVLEACNKTMKGR